MSLYVDFLYSGVCKYKELKGDDCMKDKIPFNLVSEIEENNEWIMEKIKQSDKSTYEVLTKVKANIFMLQTLNENELAIRLSEKYKNVIVSAYVYFLNKTHEKK